MKNRVIELIRVSTDAQAASDRASIPAQRAVNQRTARAYGLEIVETIELVDVSGAAVLRSPGMQRLLKRIEDPEIEGVIVREFSRLMRPENFADYALLQVFQDTGAILFLPDGPVDFGSKTGRLLGSIRAAIAGLERTEILERIFAAKEEKRRSGKCPQSEVCLPFAVGYDARTEKWFYKPEVEKVREAARLFLTGQTSYKDVGRKVGIDAFNLRIILRNPIYTGWKVYDKRRDPSSAAIRTRDDGRQADRPKIDRAPEDVIRVRVLEPVISETEFTRLQHILDLKKQHHWRVRPDHHRRFTYGGFLRCSECGNPIYTHAHAPRDWYVCKSRTASERRQRRKEGLPDCTNGYMRRERLELALDALISERLRDRMFLKQIALTYADRKPNGARPELVESGLVQLKERRQRVIDSYIDGLIDRVERDDRLAALEKDAVLYENLSQRPPVLSVTSRDLAKLFGVFHEWDFLGCADKRKLLRAAMPEIHVSNYQIKGLSVIPALPHRDEVSRTGTGSSQRRA